MRLGWVAHTSNFVPEHDAHDFDRYAVSIVRFGRLPVSHGGVRPGPIAYRPPGYPAFLAGVYKAFGLQHRWVAARIVQAFVNTAAVGLIAAIGWLLWGWGPALVAAGIAAVFPPLVYVAESMYSEALYVPLELAVVAATLLFRRSPHPWRWAVVIGLLLGVLALVHPNALALAVPVVLLMWLVRRPRWSRRALAAPALALVCTVLTISPWTIRNALVLHHFVPITTELGNTMVGTYNDEARLAPDRPAAWTEPRYTPEYSSYYWMRGFDDATLDAKLRSLALHYIRKHPGYLLEVLHWNTLRLLGLAGFEDARIGGDTIGITPYQSDVGVVTFWILGVVALCGLLLRRARRVPWAFWLFPVMSYLSVVFLNTETPRFRTPIDPFFILLASLALCAAAAWVFQNAYRRRVAAPAV